MPLVETRYGHLVAGEVVFAGTFFADEFLFIPYAQQPTGKNRLRPLSPLVAWQDTLQYKTRGKFPVHSLDKDVVDQGEDCAWLNIWRPSLCSSLPVLVIIPGVEVMNSDLLGTNGMFDGAIVASALNVVVVLISYRVGPLGFMFVDGITQPNLGLSDQQIALRWINENVDLFGGDPANITLSGQGSARNDPIYHYNNISTNKYISRILSIDSCLDSSWSYDRFTEDAIVESMDFVLVKSGDLDSSLEELTAFILNLPVEQFNVETDRFGDFSFYPHQTSNGEISDKIQTITKPILTTVSLNESVYFLWVFCSSNHTRRSIFGSISENPSERSSRSSHSSDSDNRFFINSASPYMAMTNTNCGNLTLALKSYHQVFHSDSHIIYKAFAPIIRDSHVKFEVRRSAKIVYDKTGEKDSPSMEKPVYYGALDFMGNARPPMQFICEPMPPSFTAMNDKPGLFSILCNLKNTGSSSLEDDEFIDLTKTFLHSGKPEKEVYGKDEHTENAPASPDFCKMSEKEMNKKYERLKSDAARLLGGLKTP